jgi:predicted O-linked N-acetylglucosamine transferase (SPINDLY family)
MGVPVVAKLGNSLPARLSGAILSSLELGDWVAEDSDVYAAIAAEKAADIEDLARLRKELRLTISASSAGNPVLYTLAVEEAYRNIWRLWCASKCASPSR